MKVRKPSLTTRQLVTLVIVLSGTLVIMGLSWYTTKRVPHNNWLFTGLDGPRVLSITTSKTGG